MTIVCPECKAKGFVADSRIVGNAIRRRRECTLCGERWTTYEVSSAFVAFATEASQMVRSLGDLQSAAQSIATAAADYEVDLNTSLDNTKPKRK